MRNELRRMAADEIKCLGRKPLFTGEKIEPCALISKQIKQTHFCAQALVFRIKKHRRYTSFARALSP